MDFFGDGQRVGLVSRGGRGGGGAGGGRGGGEGTYYKFYQPERRGAGRWEMGGGGGGEKKLDAPLSAEKGGGGRKVRFALAFCISSILQACKGGW